MEAAGPEAIALHVLALCYCVEQETEGFVPSGAVWRLCDLPDWRATADALVDAGAWEQAEGGFRIVGFLAPEQVTPWNQLSNEEVAEKRDAWSAKKKRQRDRGRLHAQGDHSTCWQPFCPEGQESVSTGGQATASVRRGGRTRAASASTGGHDDVSPGGHSDIPPGKMAASTPISSISSPVGVDEIEGAERPAFAGARPALRPAGQFMAGDLVVHDTYGRGVVKRPPGDGVKSPAVGEVQFGIKLRGVAASELTLTAS